MKLMSTAIRGHEESSDAGLRAALVSDTPCSSCGFELWEPIALSPHSKLGLYNDSRFPGRAILALREHKESLDEMPMGTMMGFIRDIQIAMSAIRASTGAERVNVAILGNRDPHLHAHLIPRFPQNEEFPDCSPWNDARIKGKLPKEEVDSLKSSIHDQILACDHRTSADSGTTINKKQSLGSEDDLVLF